MLSLIDKKTMKLKALEVNEDADKDFYVKGVCKEVVTTVDEILRILDQGEKNRHYA